ncbi:MAG TPA: hydroxymethylbilane synthase [Chthoniobacterales bacterium]|nr:hydroxymethylbilane synthase [Chthoniobacterales bacterium]
MNHALLLQRIILGSRGSDLALAQAQMAECALRKKWAIEVQIKIIRTKGDEATSRTGAFNLATINAGRKGIFTGELERALVEKRIDVAVHSAKDIPSEMDGALIIAAVLPRAGVEDLLLRKGDASTPITTIATGSVRRQRQTRAMNAEAQIVPLRGNVPTRLRKFVESDWDAIILARAGLERLGFSPPEFEFDGHRIFAEVLPTENFLPAGGQGIIALQTREADFPVRQIVSSIDDRDTHLCLRAEREFLRLLQGDCDLPVGVQARLVKGQLELRAQVFGDGAEPKIAMGRGSDPEKLALNVFEKLEREHEHT